MNDKNLIPNSERSPRELREMGRKGGIASGESRRTDRYKASERVSFLLPSVEKKSYTKVKGLDVKEWSC